VTFRCFDKNSYGRFREDVAGQVTEWFNASCGLEAKDAFNLFFAKFMEAFDKHFPVRRKIVQPRDPARDKAELKDWYTDDLADLRK